MTLVEDRATAQAPAADEAQAQGKPTGPLYGVPIPIKDDKKTAGIRSTCGAKIYAGNVPKENAPAVQRLLDAGAIIVGKTNLPEWVSDFQSYNEVAGHDQQSMESPADLRRVHERARVGAGPRYGVSGTRQRYRRAIRTPSHFCGVFGHKPTIDVISDEGFVEPPDANPSPDRLSVIGPLSRNPRDLLLALQIAGGPAGMQRIADSWNLPPARGAQLRDYRIGYNVGRSLLPGGAGLRIAEWYGAYFTMLGSSVVPNDPTARRCWADYFRDHDAFPMPVDFVTAFPHDHSPDMMARKIATPTGPCPYLDMLKWIFHATLTPHA